MFWNWIRSIFNQPIVITVKANDIGNVVKAITPDEWDDEIDTAVAILQQKMPKGKQWVIKL